MKSILTLVLALVMSTFVFAAGNSNQNSNFFELGAHAGWNTQQMNLFSANPVGSVKSRVGWIAGAYIRLNIKSLYIEPCFDYAHNTTGFTSGDIDIKKINQFRIPIFVGYKMMDTKIFNFRLFVGPEVNFLMDKEKWELVVPEDNKFSLASWKGRAGLGFDLWRFIVNVDYRFNWSNHPKQSFAARGWNYTVGFRIF